MIYVECASRLYWPTISQGYLASHSKDYGTPTIHHNPENEQNRNHYDTKTTQEHHTIKFELQQTNDEIEFRQFCDSCAGINCKQHSVQEYDVPVVYSVMRTACKIRLQFSILKMKYFKTSPVLTTSVCYLMYSFFSQLATISKAHDIVSFSS